MADYENQQPGEEPVQPVKRQAPIDWQWTFNRARDILVKPKETWPVIKAEADTIKDVYGKYVFILAAIPPIFSFLGRLFTIGGFFSGLVGAIIAYALTLGILYVFAIVVEFLVPKFDGSANRTDCFKLLAYSYTPQWVGGVLLLIPALAPLTILFAAYAVYLLYLGVPDMVKVPNDKRAVFIITLVVAAVLLGIVVGVLVLALGLPFMLR